MPFALGAMATLAVFLVGCWPEEPQKPEVPPANSPSVYMKDKAFRAKLDAQTATRTEIAIARDRLLTELEQRVDAMRAKMPGADDAAVKKELEKDPEWNSLVRRIADANAAYEDNRKATTKIVAERIAPGPKPVSK